MGGWIVCRIYMYRQIATKKTIHRISRNFLVSVGVDARPGCALMVGILLPQDNKARLP
jgi:hypothetical protein